MTDGFLAIVSMWFLDNKDQEYLGSKEPDFKNARKLGSNVLMVKVEEYKGNWRFGVRRSKDAAQKDRSELEEHFRNKSMF